MGTHILADYHVVEDQKTSIERPRPFLFEYFFMKCQHSGTCRISRRQSPIRRPQTRLNSGGARLRGCYACCALSCSRSWGSWTPVWSGQCRHRLSRSSCTVERRPPKWRQETAWCQWKRRRVWNHGPTRPAQHFRLGSATRPAPLPVTTSLIPQELCVSGLVCVHAGRFF